MRQFSLLWALGLVVVACGSAGSDTSGTNADNTDGGSNQGPNDGGGGPTTNDASTPTGDAGGSKSDAGTTASVCADGEAYCSDHLTANACVKGQWQKTTCTGTSGCVQGACISTACSDECALGDVKGAQTCALYDMKSSAFIAGAPTTSTDDRARAYEMWIRKDGLPFGGVADAHYSDPGTFQHVDMVNDTGDSALFTGTYLAAEALRLIATGSSDARANVARVVSTLHLFQNVAGEPGILARYAVASGTVKPFSIPDLDCTQSRVHCNIPYAGTNYDYVGDISRDQYQGLLLGYSIAYDALGSEGEATRAIIRADVVTLVKELMKDRSVPVHLTYSGIALPVTTITMRFIVVDPREMDNGAVDFTIETTGSKNVTMSGFQEFTPDLADIVRQFPGLSFAPSIPRASSAIMLASSFRVALQVTDGIAASKTDHDAILAYYTSHAGTGGNVTDWLAIAKQWASDDGCGSGYYANNITMEPMYSLSRLETDPTLKSTIQKDVLDAKLWPAFVATKNPFFSFIYAGTYAAADPGVAPDAASQLAQFVAPPNVQRPINLLTNPKYPHDATCTNQVDHSTAVDIGDRVPGDFMWQRDPWELQDPGNPGQTEPGVDYLVAYWMGRRHAFIADDTPTACLVWK